jgi:motility quorum-sensing regulator / GCU-specific mRNA interferase toxin
MTEKKTPHHDLEAFKSAFSTTKALRVTRVALKDAAELGYGSDEIVSTIQTMETGQFYKSMTSKYSDAVWQDVYHVPPLMAPSTSNSLTML